MTEWISNDIDQFWGLSEDLGDAIAQWSNVPSAENRFYVALCIGHCKLFQIPQTFVKLEDFAAEDAFGELFYTAWREVRRITQLVTQECEAEDGILQASGGDIEACTLALDVLQSRMLFQGLSLFFDELQSSAINRDDKALAESFRQRLAVYHQLVEDLDEAIDANPEPLSVVAESTWPHNVRMTLPTNAWQPTPWWLTEYADLILGEHRELVQRLTDPQLAGTITASLHTNHVELKRPPDAVAEIRNTKEFSLAADSSLAASFFELAEFRGDTTDWSLSASLQISIDFHHSPLHTIPESTPCVCQVSILSNSSETIVEDDLQLWRLRWGPLIINVPLKRFASNLTTEWIGDFKISVGDLQHLAQNGSWPKQHWRRLH